MPLCKFKKAILFGLFFPLFLGGAAQADNTANQQLFDAVQQAGIKAVEAAVASGANINAIGGDGLTPLMSAAIKKQVDMVQFLLQQGANVNKANSKGQTALMAAVAGGNIDIVKALLTKGAKIDVPAKNGKYAVDIARGQNKEDIAVLLEEKSARHANAATTSSAPHQPSVDVQSYTGPMVTIPSGEFLMGSSDADTDAQKDEKPQHQVAIKSFKLAQYAVTFEQFTRFIEETSYDVGTQCWQLLPKGFQLSPGNFRSPSFAQGKLNPVVCVSWDDAQAYIDWLNKKTKQHFRLPTEAEREYATRAGSTTKYSFGDDANQFCRYGNGADQAGNAALTRDFKITFTSPLSCNDGAEYTTTVGRYLPNAFGLYDMSGNIWEWVQDCYHENYAGAPDDGECKYRVVRGGAWYDDPADLRSANRGRNSPDNREALNGFRLAQDR
ncbi:MAG TPA: SUMF1/EgtB/PvdO family nonheme iron enzyme [Spongiibacteraceae bacterium]|jgi:formylglycine-generating enzyme required for sulfatase activity